MEPHIIPDFSELISCCKVTGAKSGRIRARTRMNGLRERRCFQDVTLIPRTLLLSASLSDKGMKMYSHS